MATVSIPRKALNVKWKVTAATLAAIAITSAPLAGAAPGNGNGKKPVPSRGQTISAIAKAGGGAAGVLGALVQLKPGNLGLQNALKNVTKPKPTSTPSPTTQTTAPAPTATPTATVTPTP